MLTVLAERYGIVFGFTAVTKGTFNSGTRSTFGDISRRKVKLLARLNEIQHSLQGRHNNFLCRLEVELQAKLEEVLVQEELLWFQKVKERVGPIG